jgi:hypothetical protein
VTDRAHQPRRATTPPADTTVDTCSLWARYDQFFLYAIAAVTYIILGIFLRTFVLNWVVGPLYLLFIVWILPGWIRTHWGKNRYR